MADHGAASTAAAATTAPAAAAVGGNVQVAVRVRRLTADELLEGCRETVTAIPETGAVTVGGAERAFSFDYVFNPDADQAAVYSAVEPLVTSFLQGYNATVFAYGQTGSGKTYTMGSSGSDDTRGMIPRVINTVMQHVRNTPGCELTASFVEIYNEELRDLLATDPTAPEPTIRSDVNGSVTVVGAITTPITDEEDISKVLASGTAARATGCTAMNAQSSRSHAILSLQLIQQGAATTRTCEEPDTVDESTPTSSVLHLVDLAGSERAKKTLATGARLKEGAFINKGLFVLGNVINALSRSNGQPDAGHVPYRDSKLTRMLQDALGGNSKTLMITCVSPADRHFDETLNSLRYAQRARSIQNRAVVNVDSTAATVAQLRRTVQLLQQQLLQAQACGSGSGGAPATAGPLAPGAICGTVFQNNQLKAEIAALTARNVELEQRMQEAATTMQLMCQQIAALESKEPHDAPDAPADGEAAATAPSAPSECLTSVQWTAKIADVTQELCVKEKLLAAMTTNSSQLAKMKAQYEAKLTDLQQTIAKLENERAQLAAGSHADKSKRLAGLDIELAQLRKQEMLIKRLASEKAQQEKQIHDLQADVSTLKAARVDMMRRLKALSTEKRNAEVAANRTISTLQKAKQTQDMKMKQLASANERKELVLKQRLEATQAKANRLQQVVQKQADATKQKQAMRIAILSKDSSTATVRPVSIAAPSLELPEPGAKVPEEIARLFKREIERQVWAEQTRALMESACAQRAKLAASLAKAEADPSADTTAIRDQVTQLSAEIATFQQALARPESETSSGWSKSIVSLDVAKHVLSWLMTSVAQGEKTRVSQANRLAAVDAEHQAIKEQATKLQAELDRAKVRATIEQAQWQLEHEQRLLSMWEGRSACLDMPSMDEISAHLSVPSVVLDAVNRLNATSNALLSQLEPGTVPKSVTPDALGEADVAMTEPASAEKPAKRSRKAVVSNEPDSDDDVQVDADSDYVESEDEEDEDEWEDDESDEDWIEHEPKPKPKARNSSSGSAGTAVSATTRVLATVMCICKGKCMRNCACRASALSCGDHCGCKKSLCTNHVHTESTPELPAPESVASAPAPAVVETVEDTPAVIAPAPVSAPDKKPRKALQVLSSTNGVKTTDDDNRGMKRKTMETASTLVPATSSNSPKRVRKLLPVSSTLGMR